MDLNDHGDAAAARLHAAKGLGFTIGSDLNDRISLVNTEVWSGHEEANLSISKGLDAEDQDALARHQPVLLRTEQAARARVAAVHHARTTWARPRPG